MDEAEKTATVQAVRVQYAADLFRTVAFVTLGAVVFSIGTNMGILDSIAYGCLTLLVYGVIGKGIEALAIRRILDSQEQDNG